MFSLRGSPIGTPSLQDLCKLEIMRQDKTFEWYEVRSSMRLAWLKAKQMIIPVEVICSFQQMHTDSPAGSANSIVARLQRVSVAKGRERRRAHLERKRKGWVENNCVESGRLLNGTTGGDKLSR